MRRAWRLAALVPIGLVCLFALGPGADAAKAAKRAKVAPVAPVAPVAAPVAPPPAGALGANGQALPVRVGVQFVALDGIDENEQTFDATVDTRLVWTRRGAPPMERHGETVEAALAELGAPRVEIDNLVGDPAFRERGLFVTKGGQIELLERTRGTFATTLDEQSFPFDRQALEVAVVVREASTEEVGLEFHGEDVAFSHAQEGVSLGGWSVGTVDLSAAPLLGWHEREHARVIASLNAQRLWMSVVPTLFIPLFSSLLIPMIAIWLQKVSDEGDFEVDAFELANIVIGGLFAVIALNFTVNSEYSSLASGDNTVTRLFALNYAALAIAMVINIGMFQYKLVERWFGKYVQEQLYWFLCGAVPALAFGAAATFLLVAWA